MGLLLLVGCSDLPRPYQGAPGATATRLARPPPARIAVMVHPELPLPDSAGAAYARIVATSLQQQEVPAVTDAARAGDWQLALGVQRAGATMTPVFTLIAPAGQEEGTEQARPVPVDAWQSARPETMQGIANDAAPRIAALLGRVEAARRQSSPASLNNRPGRAALIDVTGAPGDGNQVLARLMRENLGKLGQVVQESTVGADFLIKAQVNDRVASPKTRQIEIFWLIQNTNGEEIGRISQQNEVTNGTLDRHWGDVAVVVTEEAAVAIRDVILNQSGRR